MGSPEHQSSTRRSLQSPVSKMHLLSVAVVALSLVYAVQVEAGNKCVCCGSGIPGGWQNPYCPCDGNINGWPLDSQNTCDGLCITRKLPNGEIQRDCESILPPRHQGK